MRGSGGQRGVGHRRLIGLGLLLIGAALGPLVYCLGWGEVPAQMEAMTLGVCLERHVLMYPTTLFLSGVGSIFLGLILMVRRQVQGREEAALNLRIQRRASQLEQRQSPRGRGLAMEALEGIEVEEELLFESLEAASDLEAEKDRASMMTFLEEERLRRRSSVTRTSPALKGLYCPPGMEGAALLYLDSEAPGRPVQEPAERIDNPNLPHRSLQEALKQALAIVMKERRPVMVRVMPGVYQGGVELPDQVALVNHRMPAEATVDERLTWLEEQGQIDHPERVTIMAPDEGDVVMRCLRGQRQGIFGCYFMGRQGLSQRGLEVQNSGAVAIIHCGFEDFSKGAVAVEDSGQDLPGLQVQFLGCRWRGNAAPDQGGALFVRRSAVVVEASVFDSNIARRGGAVAVVDVETPFLLERSLLQRNRAIWSAGEEQKVEDLSLEQWRRLPGVGGALAVQTGLAKVVDTIFEGNDGALAGGAIAAEGARVIFESTAEGRGACRENRAAAGGAIFAVGSGERAAMIRLQGVILQLNLAKTMGGAGAALGQATLHFEGGEVARNQAAGGAQRGLGGGIVAWRGATVQARKLLVAQNKADAGGGAVAAINAHLAMIDGTMLLRNTADGPLGGGAILAITAPDMELERLLREAAIALPIRVKLDGLRATQNQAAGVGGGLRAGNTIDLPSFPMELSIRRPDWIVENQSAAQMASHQIWVQWARKVKAKDGLRGRLELKLYGQSLTS